jgi:anti-sigma factor RsiW
LARRARRDAAIQTQVKHHFDPVLDEPIPPRLLAIGRRRGLHWPRRLATAAAIVVAASGGWWLGAMQADKPAATPAFGQRIVQLLHNQPQRVSQANAASAPIRHPDLSARGYRLVASQVLHRGGRPLSEFLYRNNRGAQVKIYAQALPHRLANVPTMSTDNGVPLARWRHNGVGYTLVGNMPSRALHALAQTAAATRPDAPPRNAPAVKPSSRLPGGPTAVPASENSARPGTM